MKRQNFFFIALYLIFFLINSEVFADFQKGLNASLNRDFATAVKEWEPLAKRGDATPQFQLGWLYQEGLGVPQNSQTAIKWYKRASEQGYAYAQSALGRMYEKGQGISKDYSRAYLWFSLADLLWDPDANIGQKRVLEKMSENQIKLAKKLILSCIKKKYIDC